MPELKKLTREQDRERKLELTKIRRLRAQGMDDLADRKMTEYRKAYWVPNNLRSKDGRFIGKRRLPRRR